MHPVLRFFPLELGKRRSDRKFNVWAWDQRYGEWLVLRVFDYERSAKKWIAAREKAIEALRAKAKDKHADKPIAAAT